MKTYIPQNSTRDEFLLSLYIQYHKKSHIDYFIESDIYEICLAQKADIVILNDNNIGNPHIQKILLDFENKNIDSKSKIILLTTQNKKYNSSQIITIPQKTYLPFNDLYTPDEIPNYPYILCYLNNKNLDKHYLLEPIIYPINQSIPVKIVNSPVLQHPQNLGMASEKDMINLIAGCYAYVCLSNDYLYDALLMNKRVITGSEDNGFISPVSQPLSLEYIEQTPVSSEICDLSNIRKYSLSNITKYIIK